MEPQHHDLQLLQRLCSSASRRLSFSTNSLVHHMDREKSVTVVADADLADPSAAGSSAARTTIVTNLGDPIPMVTVVVAVVEVLGRV